MRKGIDKCATVWYNDYSKREVNNMFYIKSVSGQVYEIAEMPKFCAGYEMVGRAEYEEWLKKIFG